MRKEGSEESWCCTTKPMISSLWDAGGSRGSLCSNQWVFMSISLTHPLQHSTHCSRCASPPLYTQRHPKYPIIPIWESRGITHGASTDGDVPLTHLWSPSARCPGAGCALPSAHESPVWGIFTSIAPGSRVAHLPPQIPSFPSLINGNHPGV